MPLGHLTGRLLSARPGRVAGPRTRQSTPSPLEQSFFDFDLTNTISSSIMQSMIVPITTAIKRNRVGNVDSTRLLRRHSHLLDMIYVRTSEFFPNRLSFAMRAAELDAVEREIVRRGITSQDQLMVMRRHARNRKAFR